MNPTAVTTPIRTVVIDDESSARRGLALLLGRDPDIVLVGEAAAGDEAVDLLGRARPDLAFLDVQMPGADGFAVLGRLDPASAPIVVFVTAYDEYALRAFEVNAADYLLKPYDDARFAAALTRAKGAVRRRRIEPIDQHLARLLDYLRERGAPGAAGPEPRGGDRILVKSAGEIFFLKPDEIDWIEAEGDYMKFHVAGRTHLMRETMARLAARLDPQRFVRVHRSTIVNIERVRKLSPSFGGDYSLVLQDGTKLRLSRGYHDSIATLLKRTR